MSMLSRDLLRRDHHSAARAAALYLCRKLTGSGIRALGERFGGISGAAVSKAVARLAARVSCDRRLARRVRRCERLLEQMSNVKT
ncbi:hypothetical protein ACFL09_04200 [Planctomycetota bacterium]